MSISTTEAFEWVPLHFEDLMKSVGNNYIHWSLDLCVREVSGWREERSDLMLRNNCHCTLDRDR